MYFYPIFRIQAKQEAPFRLRPLNPVPSIQNYMCGVSQGAALSIIFNRCLVCLLFAYMDNNVENFHDAVCFRHGGCHSVGSVLITACGLTCLLEGKKEGIHLDRIGSV